MIRELFGTSTLYGMLREGLDTQSAAQRRIAQRVAGASMPLAGDAIPPAEPTGSSGKEPPEDLEAAMVDLASTQLRFDATARLLQRAYAQLRTAMRNG
jgi:hypothetical protein